MGCLVVGKNAKVWNAVKTKITLDVNEVSFKEVVTFSVRGKYKYAIVFSYSKNMEDNKELLGALSKYCEKIIYVSTMSVHYAIRGYLYNYPVVKLHCEEFLKQKGSFSHVLILRIGVVNETQTQSFETSFGSFFITPAEVLAQFLNHKTELNPGCETVELFNLVENRESRFGETILRKIYKTLNAPGRMIIITRPLDFILRKLNYMWYGYNEK